MPPPPLAPLGQDTHRAVALQPIRRAADGTYRLGAAGPDGQFLDAFAHRWCRPDTAGPPPGARLRGPTAYGGVAMNHFGHFLLEALSRLWFLQRHPELPVVWHWIDLPVPHATWPGWIGQLLRLVGLGGHRHVILRQPALAEEIVVAESGFRTMQWLHPDQAAALSRLDGPADAPGGRIWLSRAHLPPTFGRIEGEAAVEDLLTRRGWTVLRPEMLPVMQQAGLFAAADVVSGFAGSAFHAVLLQASPRACLRPVIRPAVQMRDYGIIAATRTLNQVPIDAALTALDSRGSWTSYRIGDPADLAARIDAP
ncbi:glycosyltransferase 61 family protein [Roseomonas sp. CAU 1739]|uniref:glycosyltransferase family 61 protein n=1 Tax=Roseomonas sp. CAU 1739 TaxID=3140364 RepID=UPI00325AF9C7